MRLSTVSQELDAVRQAVSTMPASTTSLTPGQDPAGGGERERTAPNGTSGRPVVEQPPARAAAHYLQDVDNADSDYTAGHHNIEVIMGVHVVHRRGSSRNDKADDAQLNIGRRCMGPAIR